MAAALSVIHTWLLSGFGLEGAAPDEYPASWYAVSNFDMSSGKLYWLEGDEPLATWDCRGYTVMIYRR